MSGIDEPAGRYLAGGPPVIIGLAVMISEQTRLRRVYGFLDPVPAPIPVPGAER
ncbi:hypothetical protein AB0D65_06815 [Streptomyces griseoloalbus]|uniref:Uncharacterized protein n=1 Tax=Streptomyces griseoloalbus TaxID=67303 RepID=A0ABV3E3C3_9ACTN